MNSHSGATDFLSCVIPGATQIADIAIIIPITRLIYFSKLINLSPCFRQILQLLRETSNYGYKLTGNSNCDQIRRRLNNQQNDLIAAHTRIIPARQEVQHFERQVSDLKSQIRNAELQAVAGRVAPRALGPGGVAVSTLNLFETDIRIGRLNGELSRAEANFRDANGQLESAENQIRAFESHIDSTEAELSRSGCG